ncbi:MAG: hypothetical protein PVF68_04770 [Acidobacteriota bacterium]
MTGKRSSRSARRPRSGPGRELHRRVVETVRRRVQGSPGGHLIEDRLGTLELSLEIDLRDPQAGEEAVEAALEEAVARFVDEAIEAAAAFRPGRAFCHRCESADCAHARPGGSREVFAGYGPTGMPRWRDFGQLCLEQHHPEVDRLYDERRPQVIALALDGAVLKGELMPEFHRAARVHDVVGQICAGLFRLPDLGEPLALTFQAVVSRRRRGGRRVGLNLIGGGPGTEGRLAAVRPEAKPWRAAVLWAQARLDALGRRSGRGRLPGAAFDARVRGVLQGLSRRIERDLRGRGRRTRHAEQRHRSGDRPTRKAVEDLRTAPDGSILIDGGHGTRVVLGERGRTHFFAGAGRLVSSVKYPREAIEKRLRTGQWRPATAEEIRRLRETVLDAPGHPAAEGEGDG